jgi:multiple antibiotic resistance protein
MEQSSIMEYATELLKTFIALFVIINPLAIIPVYLSLTSGMDLPTKNRVVKISAISTFCVLFISAVAGEIILKIFGISIPAFQVGGGILLSTISYNMMMAKDEQRIQTPEEKADSAGKGIGIAVVPLTIPMLTGPGTMSLAIVTASKYHSFLGYFYIIVSAALISVIIYYIFKSADKIKRMIGITGMNILTKVLSLLLMALAIELIADGVRLLLPGLNLMHV